MAKDTLLKLQIIHRFNRLDEFYTSVCVYVEQFKGVVYLVYVIIYLL